MSLKKTIILTGLLVFVFMSLLYFVPKIYDNYQDSVKEREGYYDCMIGFATDYCLSINLSNATYYGNGFVPYQYFKCHNPDKRVYDTDDKYLLTEQELKDCDVKVAFSETKQNGGSE